jgi:signal transduction histidine kinase/CheY-like chemotaxis protein
MFVRGLGLFVALGGVLSFLGWALDVQGLTDWDGSGISIQPNATVAVMCAGTAVLLLTFGFRRAAAALGVVVAVIGILSLFQYFTDISLPSFNTALMFDRTWGRGGVIDPGRMGPPGAMCWTLVGACLVMVSGKVGLKARRVVPAMALLTCSIATLAITGYLYSASALFSAPRLTVIAFQTAIFILAISAALTASVPERGPMRLLRDDGPAGYIARRATPAIIIVAFGLGLLRLQGERAGFYDLTAGTAARTVVEIIALLGLLWWSLAAIRRHDQAMRENRRRKDEFLAVLAHELRGPLAPLRNSLEIVKRVGGDGVVQQARETMDRQLHHLVRLVDDLVDVSRITHDKIELRKRRVDLAPILRQALETAEPLAASAGLRLDVTLPPEPIPLDADPVRLTQVFSNILNNACKYTPPGGAVRLVAERHGAEAVVRIRDTGMGIAADQLDYVFEMFTQVERADRPLGGLGVGLTLVKRLLDMHGGTVTAHSDGPGKGSEFVVRLPVLKTAATTGLRTSDPAAIPPARRILVVDDNPDAADSLAALLAIDGNETHTAHDGVEAVQAAERLRPDVVLLDIGLPKLNGLEACRRIREQPWGKDMMLVALTGLGQADDRVNSAAAGFDRHMVKPVDYAALMRLLSEKPPAAS